jgi:hypothetical protein
VSYKKSVEKVGAAQDDVTDWLELDKDERYTLSLSGTFVGTIAFERELGSLAGATTREVATYTAVTEQDGIAAEACRVRLKVKAYTSGSPAMRLGR